MGPRIRGKGHNNTMRISSDTRGNAVFENLMYLLVLVLAAVKFRIVINSTE
jgi:hypothetical protein